MINTSYFSDSDLQMIRDAFNAELERRRAAEAETRDAELLQADRNLAEDELECGKNVAALKAETERLYRAYAIHVKEAENHRRLALGVADKYKAAHRALEAANARQAEIKSRRDRIHKAWIQSHPTR